MPALNLDTLKAVATVNLAGDSLCVTHAPNSERLWIGSSDFKVYSLDLAEAKPQPSALGEHKSYVTGVVLVGKTLVSSGWDRKLIWWDTEKRASIRTVDAHARWIRRLVVSPDGTLLATASDDMACKLWDAASGKLVRELRGHEPRLTPYHYPNKLYTCAFAPDGKYVAAADETCRVVVWETATGKEAAKFDAPTFFKADWDRNNHPYGGLRCLAFSPDGKSLALGGMQNADVAIISGDALVQVFDWRAGKSTHEFKPAKDSQYESLFFHPQGDWLLAVVGGTNKNAVMHFLDLKQKRVLKEVGGLTPTFGLDASDKVDALYTVGRDKVMKWQSIA